MILGLGRPLSETWVQILPGLQLYNLGQVISPLSLFPHL